MESEKQKISAYRFICECLERTPGTPYAFQDARSAGKEDVSFSLFHDDMPLALQEKCAKNCCDELIKAVPTQAVTAELSSELHILPSFTYFKALLYRIKTCVDEGLLDYDLLYRFGLILARESWDIAEVKLGIPILSLFQNDITKAIFKTLGLHSEFTMPVLLSVESWSHANDFIFDLAKETTGFGRLAAVMKCKPLSAEKQRWMFYEAVKTPVCREIIANSCLSSVDMESFFEALFVDETAFHALSRLFAYAFLDASVADCAISKTLVLKYMAAAEKNVKDFIDLAALVIIADSMQPRWTDMKADVQKDNGWSSKLEEQIRDECEKYQHSLKYRRARLIAEMDDPVEDNVLIMKVLTAYAYDYSFSLPDFSAFEHMLDADPFDMAIAQFVLLEHPIKYAKDIAERILAVIPFNILTKPEIIDKDELTPEYRPDVWLLYLLKARKVVQFECEHLCLSCLTARFQDLRIEAITTLRLTRALWSDNVIPALERACETEPDPKIVKRIKRLLGIKADGKKEQRYVDVGDVAVVRSAADRPILETVIAGTFFRDMKVIAGILDDGDTLFLKREPDNQYDSNAILVTTEDGYVLGYIPKVENPPLAQFMDAGERLYAVLCVDPALYEGKPPITVYVSRAAGVQGKVIPFPRLLKE